MTSAAWSLVDCTSVELDRDPKALLRMAEATGFNIVMGCGHYRDPYIDREQLDRRGVEGLAADLIGGDPGWVRGDREPPGDHR